MQKWTRYRSSAWQAVHMWLVGLLAIIIFGSIGPVAARAADTIQVPVTGIKTACGNAACTSNPWSAPDGYRITRVYYKAVDAQYYTATYAIEGQTGTGEWIKHTVTKSAGTWASLPNGYKTIRVSENPFGTIEVLMVELELNTAPSAAITSQDPAFVTWAYSDPTNDMQGKFRARLLTPDGSRVLHDSGEQAGTASRYQLPGANGTLQPAVDLTNGYRWEVTVWDLAGASGSTASGSTDGWYAIPAGGSVITKCGNAACTSNPWSAPAGYRITRVYYKAVDAQYYTATYAIEGQTGTGEWIKHTVTKSAGTWASLPNGYKTIRVSENPFGTIEVLMVELAPNTAPSAAITSQDPAFVTWAYSDPTNDMQGKFRARLLTPDGSRVLHDSGEQAGTSARYQLPGANGTLQPAVDLTNGYRWEVTVWDLAGASGSTASGSTNGWYAIPTGGSVITSCPYSACTSNPWSAPAGYRITRVYYKAVVAQSNTGYAIEGQTGTGTWIKYTVPTSSGAWASLPNGYKTIRVSESYYGTIEALMVELNSTTVVNVPPLPPISGDEPGVPATPYSYAAPAITVAPYPPAIGVPVTLGVLLQNPTASPAVVVSAEFAISGYGLGLPWQPVGTIADITIPAATTVNGLLIAGTAHPTLLWTPPFSGHHCVQVILHFADGRTQRLQRNLDIAGFTSGGSVGGSATVGNPGTETTTILFKVIPVAQSPQGWTAALDRYSISLAPGATATINLTATPPVGAPAGSYAIYHVEGYIGSTLIGGFSKTFVVGADLPAPVVTYPANDATVPDHFTVTGTALPGALIKLGLNSSLDTYETIADTQGGWSISLSLHSGQHILYVTATVGDKTSSTAGGPAGILITVAAATTPPTIKPPVESGKVWTTPNLPLCGTAQPGQLVTIHVHDLHTGEEFDITVTADADGNWCATILLEHDCHYEIQPITDSGAGDKIIIYVDSNPPTTTIHLPPTGGHGWYTGDSVTLVLDPSDPGNGQGVDHVEVSTDGCADWSLYPEGGIIITGDGRHIIYYRAIDKAGNISDCQSVEIPIDTKPPGVTSIFDPGTDTITITPTDDGSGVDVIECSLDGGDTWADCSGPIHFGHRGHFIIRFRCRDLAGNENDGDEEVTITHTPSLTLIASQAQYSDLVRLQATMFDGKEPVAGAHLTFLVHGVVVGTAVTDEQGAAVLDYIVGWPAATYPVQVAFAGDAALYLKPAAQNGVLTIAPEDATLAFTGDGVTLSAQVSQANDGYPGDLALTQVLFHIARKNADGTTTALDALSAPVDAQGKAALLSALPDGIYLIGTELLGHGYFTADSITAEVSIDTTPPTIDLTGIVGVDACGGSVTPRFTATDNLSGVVSLSATLDGKAWESAVPITTRGIHTLVVTAVDAKGNKAAQPVTFTVAHTPTITLTTLAGQYSDPAQMQALVMDGTEPVSGATVTFALMGQVVGTAVTDQAGIASLKYVVPLPKGTYTVSSTYAGEPDRFYCVAGAQGTLTIAPENATLAFTGDGVTLAAQVSQASDGYPGDLTRAQIRFNITRLNPDGTSSTLAPLTAPVDAQGRAAVASGLTEGVYSINAELIGNGYFIADSVTAEVVATDGKGFITGGAWWGATKDQAEFEARPNTAGVGATGNLFLRAQNLKLQIKTFDWLVVADGFAQAQGRTGDALVRISFVPGRGKAPGRLSITVWQSGKIVYSLINQDMQGSLQLHPTN